MLEDGNACPVVASASARALGLSFKRINPEVAVKPGPNSRASATPLPGIAAGFSSPVAVNGGTVHLNEVADLASCPAGADTGKAVARPWVGQGRWQLERTPFQQLPTRRH